MTHDTAPGVRAPFSMVWTYWVNLIAGVLLFIAPWVLGYTGNTAHADWASWILGALIAIFGVVGILTNDRWAEWICGICGILAFISPWVLGFSNVNGAFLASLILGAVAVIVSAIGLFVNRTAAV